MDVGVPQGSWGLRVGNWGHYSSRYLNVNHSERHFVYKKEVKRKILRNTFSKEEERKMKISVFIPYKRVHDSSSGYK